MDNSNAKLKNITVFTEETDKMIEKINEEYSTLLHAVELSLNTPDVDRVVLAKQGFSSKEIDYVNNEKKRVMDKLKNNFSIYFFSGVIYCTFHTVKFYRNDVPLRKSMYPWLFLISSFYVFTLYSMKTFNSRMTSQIKSMLINKYYTNFDLDDLEKNEIFVTKRELVNNQLTFYKFFKEKGDLIKKFSYVK